MARNSVLSWLDGRGWLVLSGGEDGSGDVRAQAIQRVSADGGVAYVTLGGNSALGEKALADMADLGAPSGYLVDVLSEDDETVRAKLSDAGMIVVEAGANVDDMRSSLLGAAAEGIKAAYENGALILAEGVSAAAFGTWAAIESGKTAIGLGWLENGFIAPGVTSVASSEVAQKMFRSEPSAIAVGIGVGSALALGPDGELETWGKQQVTVALGPGFTT